MHWLFLMFGCESWYYKPKPMPSPRIYTEQDRIQLFEPRWIVTVTHNQEQVIPVGCLRQDKMERGDAQRYLITGQNPQDIWDNMVYPEKIYIDKSIAGGPLVVDEHPGEEKGTVALHLWKLLRMDGDPYGEVRTFKLKDSNSGDMDVRVKWIDRQRRLAVFAGGPFGEGVSVVEGNRAGVFPAMAVDCSGTVTGVWDPLAPGVVPAATTATEATEGP